MAEETNIDNAAPAPEEQPAEATAPVAEESAPSPKESTAPAAEESAPVAEGSEAPAVKESAPATKSPAPAAGNRGPRGNDRRGGGGQRRDRPGGKRPQRRFDERPDDGLTEKVIFINRFIFSKEGIRNVSNNILNNSANKNG